MTDNITELSILLRKLQFDPIIDQQTDGRGNTMTTVTLRPIIGEPVSGTAPSFAIAYTIAINKLKGAALIGVKAVPA